MGLKRKMALLFACSMIVLTAGSLYFFYREVGTRILDENLERMKSFARFFERAYEAGGVEELRKRVEELGAWQGRVTLVDAEGRVLYDSSGNVLENHARRPEIVAAGSGGEGVALRYSSTARMQTHYYALALEEDGGFVRLSWPLPSLTGLGRTLTWRFFGSLVPICFLVLLLGLWVSRRIFYPLDRIVRISESVTDPKDLRFPLFKEVELQKVSMALNDMAERLGSALEETRVGREELIRIVEALPVGVLLTGKEQEVRCFNEAARGLLGAGEIRVGQPVVMLLPSALHEVFKGPDFSGALDVPGKVRRRLSVCVITLREGRLMVLRDVSEEHRMETMRRNFTIEAGHELQTPLTAIRAAAELLLEDVKEGAPRALAETILQQQERMTDLIDDLLLLIKLDETAAVHEDNSEEDLAEMLEGAAEDFRRHPLARHLRIETDLPRGVPFLCNRSELLRAFSNLLDNAVKACFEKYGNGGGGRIRLSLSGEGDRWLVTLADNGLGFSPEQAEELRLEFQFGDRPYYERNARRRERWGRGGHGLGLSIALRVIHAHGGRMELSEVPGLGGAELRILLPMFHVKR